MQQTITYMLFSIFVEITIRSFPHS